jgi:outer membrane protein assembly factor BamB
MNLLAKTAALLLTGLALTGSGTAAGDWPQFQGDPGHSGWNRSEAALTAANVSGLRPIWSVQARGAIESSVSAAAGIVYFTTVTGDVFAVRADNGQKIWSTHVSGGIGWPAPPPAITGDRALVVAIGAADENSLFAYDAGSGQLLWSDTIGNLGGGQIGAPTLASGVVYTQRQPLLAIDAETGEELWGRQPECFVCSPAVAGNRLFTVGDTGLGDTVFQARRLSDGKLLWSRHRRHVSFSSPVLAGGRAFLPAVGGTSRYTYIHSLWAYSQSGRLLWHRGLGRSRNLIESFAAVAGGRVFYPCQNGRLYALRATNGKLLWSARIGQTGSSPTIAGGVVYVVAGKKVLAFEAASGKRLWSFSIGHSQATPVVSGGMLYVGNEAGTLSAFALPSSTG